MAEEGLNCEDTQGNIEQKNWMFFTPNCNNINPKCDPTKGAWVAAITVCNQDLDSD